MSPIIMKTLSLPEGTFGILRVDDFQCFTLEPPWFDNKTNISCIPSGYYNSVFRISPNNGPCIELKKVPKRTFIQIHAGNHQHQTRGCILVGDSIKFIDQDRRPDVTNSKDTLSNLLSTLGGGIGSEFKIQISRAMII